MTNSHDESLPSSGMTTEARSFVGRSTVSSSDAERIAAELLALGEDPMDDDEARQLRDDADIGTVATLVDLSRWTAPAQGLLPLERHRVWRRIAQHVPAPVADAHQPAANGGAGWRGLVAGLSLVAGLALIPRFEAVPPPASEGDKAALSSMGQAARVAVGAMGDQDGARVDDLAERYAQRLQATRGGE